MNGSFQQTQAILRAVIESPKSIVIFALDREYRYLAYNENHARTMKHIWGADIRVGASMMDFIGLPGDRDKARDNFDRALAGESFTLREAYGSEDLNRRHYDDSYSPILAEDGAIIGLTVYLTDITDQVLAAAELEGYRNRLEDLVKQRTAELETAHAQLLHAQKLESLGVLAGGVAHDFNNLLAVVLGRVELAAPLLDADHPARSHIEIIRETALEARMLTRQLVAYAGKGRFMIQAVDLTELVESMVSLLRASIRKSVTIAFEPCEAPLVVRLDLTQARQMVLNLVANAAEAIEGPGQVTVRTGTMDVDADLLKNARVRADLGPGSYGYIEVEDTGCGMDDAVRSKLFDPFFTTKVDGHGLGLAAVLGIVKSHRGTILLRSAPGRGTLFTVLFPIIGDEAMPVAAQDSGPRAPFHGGGVALVVDDEESVRRTTAEVLQSLGYEVLQAEDGGRAIEVFVENVERVKLVLLDLTMPGLSGEQTLSEIKAIRPDVDVIVLTGYTEDEVRLGFVRGGLAGLLTKPFVRDELVDALRSATRSAP